MLTRHVAGRVYNYGYCIGRSGQFGNAFTFPLDFALGAEESLYVVNRGHQVSSCAGITKCTLNHEYLWDNRGDGIYGGRSAWPSSVDVDSNENVYVSDDYTSGILIYDKDGNPLGSWGTKGSGDGELDGPSGLAFDREDNLYIVDSLNHRVQVFTKDGTFLANWGSYGSREGQFDVPWGIAIDNEGDVYVADWNNHRVQKFSPNGEYLVTFGRSGRGDGELHRPTGVAIDKEGDVYVTDWGNDRLNIYAPDGTFLTDFIGDAEQLSPWGQATVDANPDMRMARRRADLTPEWRFKRPVAVNVDNTGRIIVLETIRYRIQVYVKEQDFVEAQFNL